VQAHDHCPEDHGDHVGRRSQGEEDGVEGEGGGEEEEQDGEDDCAEKELLNRAVSAVNTVSQGVVLFAYKESPESYETSGLTGGEPASVCVEAMKMEREKGEQVASKRHLKGERKVQKEGQQVDQVGGDDGQEEQDVGDPQVDVVEEELAQGLAEHGAEFEACRVLHHPGDQGLQPAHRRLHRLLCGRGEGGGGRRGKDAEHEVTGEGEEEHQAWSC